MRVVEDAGTVTNLTVGSRFGNEGFVTEVAVSNKLTLLSNHVQQNVPSLTVLKGGRFSVGEGGDVSLYPKSGTGSPNGNHVQFDIRNGGEFVVDGGYATVTNFGNAFVGGKVFEPAATGVFRVASGTLNVWGRAWKNGLAVRPGAKLVVDATACAKDGRVKLVDCKNCEGAFRTEDITLLGADWQIRQEPGRGLSIIKPRGIMFVVR